MPFRKIRSALHRVTLWLLVLALPVYGSSATVLQILGPVHRHVQTAAADAIQARTGPLAAAAADGFNWATGLWKSWQDFAHTQAHLHAHFSHPHAHSDFERHHHALGDTSVEPRNADGVASALAAELGAAAAAGSATLPLGLAQALSVPLPPARQGHWHTVASAAWRSADPRRLDRPPQARQPAITPFGAARLQSAS